MILFKRIMGRVKKTILVLALVGLAFIPQTKHVLAAGQACQITKANDTQGNCPAGQVCQLENPLSPVGPGTCTTSSITSVNPLVPAPTANQSANSACTFYDPSTWLNCFVNAFLASIVNIFIGFVNSIVGLAAGIGFGLAGLFIQLAINLNQTLVEKTGGPISFAHYGFSLTLQFANILIIIAIIVIAFGTMFRQSFGSKNLPRLLFIALAINFSYFLATVAINISDGIMQGFMAAAGLTDWSNLTNFLNGIRNSAQHAFTANQSFSQTVLTLISPAFNIIFDTFAIIILIGVGVMYFIRYIALSLLLILLPLALTFSLLPFKIGKGGDVWSRWSNEFTRWLIFGPAMMFFIWLAFTLNTFSASPLSSESATSAQFQSGIVGYIAALGILLGGAMIANEMGVAGAKQLNNAVQQTGKWFQTQAKDYATRPLRTEKGREWVRGLQEKKTATLLPYLGRGLTNLGIQGQKTINMDTFKGWQSKDLIAALPNITGAERVAALAQLAKNGDLGDVKDIQNFITDGNKGLFTIYGQNWGAVEKGAGINIAMASLIKSMASAQDIETQTQLAGELQTKVSEFTAGLSKKDWAKFPTDMLISSNFLPDNKELRDLFRSAIAAGIIKGNRSDFRRLLNVKGKNLETARDAINFGATQYVNTITSSPTTSDAEKKEAVQYLRTIKKSLSRISSGTLSEEKEEKSEDEEEGKKDGSDKK